MAVGVEPVGDRPQRKTFGLQFGHDRGQVGVRFVGYRERLWRPTGDVAATPRIRMTDGVLTDRVGNRSGFQDCVSSAFGSLLRDRLHRSRSRYDSMVELLGAEEVTAEASSETLAA